MLNIPKCDSNLDIKQNDKSTRLSEDYYLNSDRAFDSKVILGRIIKYKLLDVYSIIWWKLVLLFTFNISHFKGQVNLLQPILD